MWKKLIENQLLMLMTNSEISRKEAVAGLKCQLREKEWLEDVSDTREVVHYHGKLSKENGQWVIRQGFDTIPIEITCETVCFRSVLHRDEPLDVFASVAVPDPDADYEFTVDGEAVNQRPVAVLVTNRMAGMVDALQSPRAKCRALSDFHFMPADHRAAVYRFMTDNAFAWVVAHCFSYMATCKIEQWVQSDRAEQLIMNFNDQVAPVLHCGRVDLYQVLALLDVVGDDLMLSDNSVRGLYPAGWLNFLAAFALVHGCSVWHGEKHSLCRMLLRYVPSRLWIPERFLCWMMDPAQQDKLIVDLIRLAETRRDGKVREMLLWILIYGRELKARRVYDICDALFSDGIPEDLRYLTSILLSGELGPVVERYLRTEHGIEVPME